MFFCTNWRQKFTGKRLIAKLQIKKKVWGSDWEQFFRTHGRVWSHFVNAR
jgi:hypothetical protein